MKFRHWSFLARRAGRRFGRRSGQALLLAVLLMVFAALLGTTFIAVVASNLSQTARTGDKGEAVQAANAGIEYARRQLSESGLQWRPKTDAPPPQPGEAAEFSAYFDSFDLAQGWATSGVLPATGEAYHRDGFVKYPDPRALNSDTRALHFMLKVEKIASGDADNRGEKTGDLRVTVIGRAADNPAVWHRNVLYKEGVSHNALIASMRTISNWDFLAGEVPRGEVAAYDSTTFRVTLRKTRGTFPAAHFYAMIGDPTTFGQTGNAPRAAIVQSYDAANRILQLTANPSPLPVIGERVEMAAGIGAPNYINYDNSGTISTTGTPGTLTSTGEFADFSVAGNALPGSVRANGGLLWYGDVKARNLRSKQSGVLSGAASGALTCSGLMQIAPAVTPATAAATAAGTSTVKVAGTYVNSSGSAQTLADSLLAADSSVSNFPGAWGTLSASEKSQLADDGWNALSNTPSDERQVKPFSPPDITNGEGAGRYRNLTKFSEPATGYSTGAALYGYGDGVYINNPEDVEKTGSANGFSAMSDAQFRQMLFDTTTGANFNRIGVPASQSDNTKSLEEQHLRGWIGPEEFRARGALVELNSDATITITLDSRDDGTTFNIGAAPHKGWRNADGALAGDATGGGVYSRTISWPNSGVLFAEGNVRVRGIALNPPRSLTIVSMNNVFLEGTTALQTDNGTTRKLLLLARKNVVLNPTGILSRPDNQTLLKTATVGGENTLSVYDAAPFRVGDWIYIDIPNTSNEPYGCITAIDFTNGILTLDRAVSAQPAGRAVRSETDPLTNATPSLTATAYNQVLRFRQSLQRRFSATGAGDVRLAFKHSAERRDAVAVGYLPPTGGGGLPPSGAQLGAKLAADANSSVVNSPNKFLSVVDLGGAELDRFGISALTANESPTSYNLRWLGGDAQPPVAVRGRLRDVRNLPNWRYADTATRVLYNNYGIDPPLPAPYYFLAGVGNRKPNGNTTRTLSTSWPWREDLTQWGTSNTSGYKIPMATSIVATMNGAYSYDNVPGIRNDTFNATVGDWERVGQFGFNPIHGATSAAWNSEPEDVLTLDHGFYTSSFANNYTYDSRVFSRAVARANSFALRFNNRLVDGTNNVERYFDATGSSATMPYYRLARMKFENLNQFNAARVFETLAPALSIDVNAYVYAQQGSWLIIPGDYFDAAIGNSNTAAANDLDRNGVWTRGEKIAGYRFHRYNYKLNFSGAICENRSPIINGSGSVPGLVADWMDKWATTNLGAANWNATTGNPQNVTWNRGNFGNISYAFDDSAARGLLDDDTGFRLPVSDSFEAQ